jgi:hypothetical protein
MIKQMQHLKFVFFCLIQVPHYSFEVHELKHVMEKLLSFHKTEVNGGIKWYHRNKSYSDDSSFLKVYNKGTFEFALISNEFKDLNVNHLLDTVSKSPISNRGNIQRNFGYSALDITDREKETFTTMPRLTPGTKLVAGKMAKVSAVHWGPNPLL